MGAFKTRRSTESLFHPAIFETFFLPSLCAGHHASHCQYGGERADTGSQGCAGVLSVRNAVLGADAGPCP